MANSEHMVMKVQNYAEFKQVGYSCFEEVEMGLVPYS